MTVAEVEQPAAGGGLTELAGAPEGISRPFSADVWKRFRRNKLAMVGLVIIVLLMLAAIFADVIAPYGISERSSGEFRDGPSADHLFGTDQTGRDVFSRVVHGARVSLRISMSAAVIVVVVGVFVGALAGYVGGLVETAAMRVVDIFLAIPYVVLAVALATAFTENPQLSRLVGGRVNIVILILGFTNWPTLTRIVRSSFLSIKQLEYVEAAHALGLSRMRIIRRHILPNALQPILVYGTISIGALIISEAALSFLGVGPQEPTPAWGLMVRDGKSGLTNAPHMLIFPGLAIIITVLSFVFVGDGLRDALDPKLRGRGEQ